MCPRPDLQEPIGVIEDRDWQRLDKWLWCARFMKARADCARLVAGGLVRINRQPTDKPHARLRVGDVLTVPLREQVRVLRVVSLAGRRGPSEEARRLYEEIVEAPVVSAALPCARGGTSAYAGQSTMSGG
jgi:ribosome-associated heat shock protein Hsp15